LKNLQLPYKACIACVSITSPGIIESASDADNDNAFGQVYIRDGLSGLKMERESEVSYPPMESNHAPHSAPEHPQNPQESQ
jgi:hypothetical protein